MTTTTITAAQLPGDLEALLRALRLPHARAIAADVLATARAQRWEPAEVVKALLTEETAGRARSMLASRRKSAGFPTGKTFDVWDPGASSIPLPTQQALQTLEWVQRRENLVVCGPAGAGKRSSSKRSGRRSSKPACRWPGSPSSRSGSSSARTAPMIHSAKPSRRSCALSSSSSMTLGCFPSALMPPKGRTTEFTASTGDHQASITTPDTSIPLPRSAATFDNSKPSATPSHSLRPRKLSSRTVETSP